MPRNIEDHAVKEKATHWVLDLQEILALDFQTPKMLSEDSCF